MPTLTEAVNGRVQQKGRESPPERLYDFTFEGTGRTVQVRKLSALIRDEVRRAVRRDLAFPKEPEPPMEEIAYGDRNIKHPNRGHPIYVQLLKEWNEELSRESGERLISLVIRRGVVCEVDEAAVKQLRADMAAVGVDLSEYDNHYVYVAFVCVGPSADYQELLRAVFERSIPSEEAVQAHIDSFRRAISREEPLASEPGPASGEGDDERNL